MITVQGNGFERLVDDDIIYNVPVQEYLKGQDFLKSGIKHLKQLRQKYKDTEEDYVGKKTKIQTYTYEAHTVTTSPYKETIFL